jgi:hypothetical protein
MVHWKNSYKFGKAQEVRIHPIIKDFFKRDIIPTIGQYAKYDFYDEQTNYEVKSRTNAYAKYPTTMITFNKCCECDKDKELILLFNFIDGLYFIKFEEEKFKNYQKQLFSRAKIQEDEKEHIYIPITDLTLIQKWDNPVVGGF